MNKIYDDKKKFVNNENKQNFQHPLVLAKVGPKKAQELLKKYPKMTMIDGKGL